MSKANREVKKPGKHPIKWDPKPPFGPKKSKAKKPSVVANGRK